MQIHHRLDLWTMLPLLLGWCLCGLQAIQNEQMRRFVASIVIAAAWFSQHCQAMSGNEAGS